MTPGAASWLIATWLAVALFVNLAIAITLLIDREPTRSPSALQLHAEAKARALADGALRLLVWHARHHIPAALADTPDDSWPDWQPWDSGVMSAVPATRRAITTTKGH